MLSYVDPNLYSYYYDRFCPRWREDSLARASLRVVQQPTVEPVDLEEAATHLNIDGYLVGSPPETMYPDAAGSAMLSALIVAAREYVEGLSGCMLAPQVLELGFRDFSFSDSWGDGISLRTWPVTGIESVSYYDTDNVLQVLDDSNYFLDSFIGPARLHLSAAGAWPSTYSRPNAVRVRFQAGFDARGSSPTDNQIPESLRSAVLLMLGHLYANREAIIVGTIASELPLGITALVQRYRVTDPLA